MQVKENLNWKSKLDIIVNKYIANKVTWSGAITIILLFFVTAQLQLQSNLTQLNKSVLQGYWCVTHPPHTIHHKLLDHFQTT